MNDNEMIRRLFAAMPDEQPLSEGFNASVMDKVRRTAAKRAKMRLLREYACYALGAVAMFAVCLAILNYLEIDIRFPALAFSVPEFHTWSLSGLNSEIFSSRSWHVSLFTAAIAFFLLLIDMLLTRHFEK
jgi:uncharacterized membrane protein